MVTVNRLKYACDRCIRGHRVSGCKHLDVPLRLVKKKGRPPTQCPNCHKLLPKTGSAQSHCQCGTSTIVPSNDTSDINELSAGSGGEDDMRKDSLYPEDITRLRDRTSVRIYLPDGTRLGPSNSTIPPDQEDHRWERRKNSGEQHFDTSGVQIGDPNEDELLQGDGLRVKRNSTHARLPTLDVDSVSNREIAKMNADGSSGYAPNTGTVVHSTIGSNPNSARSSVAEEGGRGPFKQPIDPNNPQPAAGIAPPVQHLSPHPPVFPQHSGIPPHMVGMYGYHHPYMPPMMTGNGQNMYQGSMNGSMHGNPMHALHGSPIPGGPMPGGPMPGGPMPGGPMPGTPIHGNAMHPGPIPPGPIHNGPIPSGPSDGSIIGSSVNGSVNGSMNGSIMNYPPMAGNSSYRGSVDGSVAGSVMEGGLQNPMMASYGAPRTAPGYGAMPNQGYEEQSIDTGAFNGQIPQPAQTMENSNIMMASSQDLADSLSGLDAKKPERVPHRASESAAEVTPTESFGVTSNMPKLSNLY